MLTSRPLTDRLTAAGSASGDIETFCGLVFDAVAADVPFEFACLATTDPAGALITGAYKSRQLPVGDEEFAASEYGGPDINQFPELAQRPAPVGVLSVDTDGHPERCRRFREFMAPRFGFTDELRLVCQAQGLTWGLLALYRGPGEPPFTAREARQVAAVHEIIANGVRRTLFADPSDSTAAAVPVVLILDAQNRLTDTSAAAADLIADLGGWVNDELPFGLLVLATSARTEGQPVTTRVLARSGSWLSMRAMTLAGPASQRSVVITVDVAEQAAVGELAIAARGLTAREQDVVALVLQGASTKVISGALHLSPHTVQDHLKAIFDKLGVSSRREMIAQFVLR